MKPTRPAQGKLWLTSAAAAAAALNSADAVVQINLVGNQITSGGGNSLFLDLTGDGSDDITTTNKLYANNPNGGIAVGRDYGYVRVEGIRVEGSWVNHSSEFGTGFAIVAGTAGPLSSIVLSSYNTGPGATGTATSNGLIPISFTDASYHDGSTVNAWLDVRAYTEFANESDMGAFLERVIWDETAIGTRPNVSATDGDFPLVGTVPEPGSLALLALGAGGLLARRRRHAA